MSFIVIHDSRTEGRIIELVPGSRRIDTTKRKQGLAAGPGIKLSNEGRCKFKSRSHLMLDVNIDYAVPQLRLVVEGRWSTGNMGGYSMVTVTLQHVM